MYTLADIGKRAISKKYIDCTQEELDFAGVDIKRKIDSPNMLANVYVELSFLEKQATLAEWNANAEISIRTKAEQTIKALRNLRSGALVPDWDDEAYKYSKMFKKRFIPVTVGTPQTRCEDIFDYAKVKIQFCKTAPIADVASYDPNIDTLFPS